MTAQHVKLNKSQASALARTTTKSASIRYLLALGWTRRQVADKVGVIYQFVRNVEMTKVKNPTK